MLIFDAHLDLAMSALESNRDLTRPLDEIRAREAGMTDKPDRGRGTVCLPEMRRGAVGLCVATQIARVEHGQYSPVFGWRTQAHAWAVTQAQLAWCRAMEEAGELVPIRNRAELESQVACWESEATAGASRPIGFVRSLEGADSLITPAHLERAWDTGLRAIGLAHYGPGIYANGTDAHGGFNPRGRDLLREIARLGLILDATHLCDDCFWEALDTFAGPVWSSHHNCRTLVPHNRQASDAMIKALVARDAVIGVAADGWMLAPGWVRGQTTPSEAGVTLERLVDHIDHICQMAGNARHAGIGSDLDGGFGAEQTPADLDTIADLQRLPALLRARGYDDRAVGDITHGNFLRFLRRTLPGTSAESSTG